MDARQDPPAGELLWDTHRDTWRGPLAGCSTGEQHPARAARQAGFAQCPDRRTVGCTFHVGALVIFECILRLGKGDAFVFLWVVNKQLRLIPRRVSFFGRGVAFVNGTDV